jgi:hypothetical protein
MNNIVVKIFLHTSFTQPPSPLLLQAKEGGASTLPLFTKQRGVASLPVGRG